jgi:hypothetical protein
MWAAQLLTTAMRYEVPTQDVHVGLSRMPTLPNSRFVIRNVQGTAWTASIFSIVGTQRAILVSRCSERQQCILAGP